MRAGSHRKGRLFSAASQSCALHALHQHGVLCTAIQGEQRTRSASTATGSRYPSSEKGKASTSAYSAAVARRSAHKGGTQRRHTAG